MDPNNTRTVRKLYTVDEAAELLAIRPRTLRHWLWHGRDKAQIPVQHVRVGRNIRFREEDIEALITPVEEGTR